MSLERLTRAYVSAVEGGASGEELSRFYHREVVLDEFSNRLNLAGARRDLSGILEANDASWRLFDRQIFDVRTLTVSGDRVCIEISWTGYLAAPLGMLVTGDQMNAQIAMVFEFEGELIVRQRAYPCYDPF